MKTTMLMDGIFDFLRATDKVALFLSPKGGEPE